MIWHVKRFLKWELLKSGRGEWKFRKARPTREEFPEREGPWSLRVKTRPGRVERQHPWRKRSPRGFDWIRQWESRTRERKNGAGWKVLIRSGMLQVLCIPHWRSVIDPARMRQIISRSTIFLSAAALTTMLAMLVDCFFLLSNVLASTSWTKPLIYWHRFNRVLFLGLLQKVQPWILN